MLAPDRRCLSPEPCQVDIQASRPMLQLAIFPRALHRPDLLSRPDAVVPREDHLWSPSATPMAPEPIPKFPKAQLSVPLDQPPYVQLPRVPTLCAVGVEAVPRAEVGKGPDGDLRRHWPSTFSLCSPFSNWAQGASGVNPNRRTVQIFEVEPQGVDR
jgi:hypothetical protein